MLYSIFVSVKYVKGNTRKRKDVSNTKNNYTQNGRLYKICLSASDIHYHLRPGLIFCPYFCHYCSIVYKHFLFLEKITNEIKYITSNLSEVSFPSATKRSRFLVLLFASGLLSIRPSQHPDPGLIYLLLDLLETGERHS